jgi:hypothetical protein
MASIVRNDFIKIAYNEQGFAMLGDLKIVKPGTADD